MFAFSQQPSICDFGSERSPERVLGDYRTSAPTLRIFVAPPSVAAASAEPYWSLPIPLLPAGNDSHTPLPLAGQGPNSANVGMSGRTGTSRLGHRDRAQRGPLESCAFNGSDHLDDELHLARIRPGERIRCRAMWQANSRPAKLFHIFGGKVLGGAHARTAKLSLARIGMGLDADPLRSLPVIRVVTRRAAVPPSTPFGIGTRLRHARSYNRSRARVRV